MVPFVLRGGFGGSDLATRLSSGKIARVGAKFAFRRKPHRDSRVVELLRRRAVEDQEIGELRRIRGILEPAFHREGLPVRDGTDGSVAVDGVFGREAAGSADRAGDGAGIVRGKTMRPRPRRVENGLSSLLNPVDAGVGAVPDLQARVADRRGGVAPEDHDACRCSGEFRNADIEFARAVGVPGDDLARELPSVAEGEAHIAAVRKGAVGVGEAADAVREAHEGREVGERRLPLVAREGDVGLVREGGEVDLRAQGRGRRRQQNGGETEKVKNRLFHVSSLVAPAT